MQPSSLSVTLAAPCADAHAAPIAPVLTPAADARMLGGAHRKDADVRSGFRSVAIRAYKRLPVPVRRAAFQGKSRYCPVCESRVRRFVPAGVTTMRPDARCPVCGSEERHRFALTFFCSETDLLAPYPKRFLHVGAAPCLETRLKRMPDLEYTSVDIRVCRGRIRADVTALPFENDSFDLICCCHVLEHVLDDFGAMRELSRVLSPAGQAVIQVPITSVQTLEDSSVTDPREREKVFGQADHVRRYGRDFRMRLRYAGFSVAVVSPSDLLSLEDRRRLVIPDDEEIYTCTKRVTERRLTSACSRRACL